MRALVGSALPIRLCRQAVDFRKGINGLAVLVESALGDSPFDGGLFVFINRRGDAVKILYWERNGFCLWHKRLEQRHFIWPRHLDGECQIAISAQQLQWLLDGLDIRKLQAHPTLHYETVL